MNFPWLFTAYRRNSKPSCLTSRPPSSALTSSQRPPFSNQAGHSASHCTHRAGLWLPYLSSLKPLLLCSRHYDGQCEGLIKERKDAFPVLRKAIMRPFHLLPHPSELKFKFPIRGSPIFQDSFPVGSVMPQLHTDHSPDPRA